MGGRFERHLVNRLYEHQFAVMRAPSSGSATDHDLPDCIALKAEGSPGTDYSGPATRWAMELKTNSNHHIYLDESEIDALVRFASRAGITPLIGCRWKQDHDAGWNQHNEQWDATARYCIRPADCYRTDDGNYRVTRPDKHEPAIDYWSWPVITDDEVR